MTLPSALVAGLAVTALLAASHLAAPPALASSKAPADVAGGAWTLVAVEGEPVPTDAGIHLDFLEDGRVAGSGGCNRFSGSYVPGGDHLAFSPLAATRMACPVPLMERERAFFAAMERVASVSRHTPETLILADADGTVVLEFRRRGDG
jgi:heat shock protein HslJ